MGVIFTFRINMPCVKIPPLYDMELYQYRENYAQSKYKEIRLQWIIQTK